MLTLLPIHLAPSVRIAKLVDLQTPTIGNKVGAAGRFKDSASTHDAAGLQRVPFVDSRFACDAPVASLSRATSPFRGLARWHRAPTGCLCDRLRHMHTHNFYPDFSGREGIAQFAAQIFPVGKAQSRALH